MLRQKPEYIFFYSYTYFFFDSKIVNVEEYRNQALLKHFMS